MTDYNVSEWNENIRRADEVESLREQKDTREMERNMAEEAAASFKERAEAAEAKLAQVEAENARRRTDADYAKLAAKLAEEKTSHLETVEHYDRFVQPLVARLAEVEKERDTGRAINADLIRLGERQRASMDQVEKERDEAWEAIIRLKGREASMDRARELAEEGAARHKDYPEPAGCLLRVARLLSGDE